MESITPENLITLAITLAIIAALLAIGHALDKYETRRAKAAAAKAEAAAKPKPAVIRHPRSMAAVCTPARPWLIVPEHIGQRPEMRSISIGADLGSDDRAATVIVTPVDPMPDLTTPPEAR